MKASIGTAQIARMPSVALRLLWLPKMMWIDHDHGIVTAATHAVGLPVNHSAIALAIHSDTRMAWMACDGASAVLSPRLARTDNTTSPHSSRIAGIVHAIAHTAP